MSSAQPENGLPERRVITADSFRALKLKLAGGGRKAAPAPSRPPEPVLAKASEPVTPDPVVPTEIPPELSQAAEPDPIILLPSPEPDEAQGPVVEEAAPVVTLAEEAAAVPEAEEIAPPVEEPQPVEPVVEAAPLSEDSLEAQSAAEPAEPQAVTDAVEPQAMADAVEPQAVADAVESQAVAESAAAPSPPSAPTRSTFVERRVLEQPQAEDAEAGMRAHALLDIMAIPTEGSLPQERALANDTLLRLIPRMPLRSLRHLSERVCLMETPSQMLVRRLINDPRIEVSGPLLENAMTVDDSDLIAVVQGRDPAKLKLIARRRIISPALSEALIQSNDVDTLINLVRNQGASFSIEAMWRLTRFAAAHPVLQAPLVTRQDTPSPIAFQLFWRLPSELRRYVLSRFLTDSETITRILTMNQENDGAPDRKFADLSLIAKLAEAAPNEAGGIYAQLTHVSEETGVRIADDAGGEALTVALKAAGLTRAQFSGIVENRPDAEALKAIFETLSFNKARVLLTYWDWAAKRTGPYARIAAG